MVCGRRISIYTMSMLTHLCRQGLCASIALVNCILEFLEKLRKRLILNFTFGNQSFVRVRVLKAVSLGFDNFCTCTKHYMIQKNIVKSSMLGGGLAKYVDVGSPFSLLAICFHTSRANIDSFHGSRPR